MIWQSPVLELRVTIDDGAIYNFSAETGGILTFRTRGNTVSRAHKLIIDLQNL